MRSGGEPDRRADGGHRRSPLAPPPPTAAAALSPPPQPRRPAPHAAPPAPRSPPAARPPSLPHFPPAHLLSFYPSSLLPSQYIYIYIYIYHVAADHWANRKLLESMLRQKGYDSECVENGLEAVEATLANMQKYDMIFMDNHMPVMVT